MGLDEHWIARDNPAANKLIELTISDLDAAYMAGVLDSDGSRSLEPIYPVMQSMYEEMRELKVSEPAGGIR